jgi:hypothetical protein
MNRTKYVNTKWEEFRRFLTASYASNGRPEEQNALHDYVPNVAYQDALADLLRRETANEKKHRNMTRRNPRDFSSQIAAKLILMQKAADGSEMKDCPSALQFLYCRREAIEAEVLGWCCRWIITDPWRVAVRALDYPTVMKEVA